MVVISISLQALS